MSTTANIGFPYLVEGQAKAEVTVNEALSMLDASLQLSVKDRHLSTPPVSPAAGDRYIVATSPTGDWAGHATHIAAYYGGWIFLVPKAGWQAWIQDEACWAVYTTAWQVTTAVANLTQSITNPPTQAEVTAIQNKINALLGQLRTTGTLKT